MIPGLYSAATAMDAAALRHEAAAENLANAHMPGFRRRVVHQTTFSTLLEGQADAGRYSKFLGTTAHDLDNVKVEFDFTRGRMKQTNRNLDIALDGEETFFVVNGPQGPLYTRNGSFLASPEGRLVTIDGLPVSGINGGDINIPAGTSSEAIEVSKDGRLFSNGVEIDQLQAVQFEDRNRLVPIGASLFSAPDGVEATAVEETFSSGYLETSNVAHMDELVNIMIASRQYEAAQRAISSVDEALEKRMQG